MRRQLSQPSFVNGYARSRGESQQPGLWLDHMWVPALGIQGSTLIDVSKQAYGAIASGLTWDSNALLWPSLDVANKVIVPSAAMSVPTDQLTLIVRFKCASFSSYPVLAAKFNYGVTATGRSYALYASLNSSAKPTIYLSSDSTTLYYRSVVSALTENVWYTIAIVYDGTSVLLYVDGQDVSGSSNGSVPASLYNTTQDFVIGHNSGDNNLYRYSGYIDYVGMCTRVLSPSQIRLLSSDPLLPLRRKPMVSLYVPVSTIRSNIFESPIFRSPVFMGVAG